MILTTSNDIAGRSVKEYLGIVRGVVARSPSITQGMLGGLKQMIGGNIESYARMCDQARQHAFDRMIEHALPSWVPTLSPQSAMANFDQSRHSASCCKMPFSIAPACRIDATTC
jgi:hypothetical protein